MFFFAVENKGRRSVPYDADFLGFYFKLLRPLSDIIACAGDDYIIFSCIDAGGVGNGDCVIGIFRQFGFAVHDCDRRSLRRADVGLGGDFYREIFHRLLPLCVERYSGVFLIGQVDDSCAVLVRVAGAVCLGVPAGEDVLCVCESVWGEVLSCAVNKVHVCHFSSGFIACINVEMHGVGDADYLKLLAPRAGVVFVVAHRDCNGVCARLGDFLYLVAVGICDGGGEIIPRQRLIIKCYGIGEIYFLAVVIVAVRNAGYFTWAVEFVGEDLIILADAVVWYGGIYLCATLLCAKYFGVVCTDDIGSYVGVESAVGYIGKCLRFVERDEETVLVIDYTVVISNKSTTSLIFFVECAIEHTIFQCKLSVCLVAADKAAVF